MSSNILDKQTRQLIPFSGSTHYTPGDGISLDDNEISVQLKTNTPSILTAATNTAITNREYPVELDANGDLAVNVPGSNNFNGTTTEWGQLSSTEKAQYDKSTGAVVNFTDDDLPNDIIGDTSIATIGDGTLTGAVSSLNASLNDYSKEKIIVLNMDGKQITFNSVTGDGTLVIGGLLVLSNNMLTLQSSYLIDSSGSNSYMTTNLNTLGGFLTDLEWDFDWARSQGNIDRDNIYIGWAFGGGDTYLGIDSNQPGLYIKYPNIAYVPTYNTFKTMYFRCKVRPKTS